MPQEGVGELILRGAQGIVRINQMEQQAIQRQRAMDNEQAERDRLFQLKQEQLASQEKTQAQQLEISQKNLELQAKRIEFEGERLELSRQGQEEGVKQFKQTFQLELDKFGESATRAQTNEALRLASMALDTRRVEVAEGGLELQRLENERRAAAGQPIKALSTGQVESAFKAGFGRAQRNKYASAIQQLANAEDRTLLAGVQTPEEIDSKINGHNEVIASLMDGTSGEPFSEALRLAAMENEKKKRLVQLKNDISQLGGQDTITFDEARAVTDLAVSDDAIKQRILSVFGDNIHRKYWGSTMTTDVADAEAKTFAASPNPANALDFLDTPFKTIQRSMSAFTGTSAERKTFFMREMRVLSEHINRKTDGVLAGDLERIMSNAWQSFNSRDGK